MKTSYNHLSATILLLLTAILLPITAMGNDAKSLLKHYPEAREGMKRFVIFLPHKEKNEEGDLKVELTIGKMMLTDGINDYGMVSSPFVKTNLKGLGYDLYTVEKLGPAHSTRMGGSKNEAMRLVRGTKTMLNYNSRTPIVVYAPKEAELHYRILSASKQIQAETK